MTTARSQQIDLTATPYYHIVCRCVRRAFLCGDDRLTQRNFDHRRGWLVERFRWLSEFFAIDIAGFACMSNHYHLIMRVDREAALGWSDEDVGRRWLSLMKPKLRGSLALSPADVDEMGDTIAVWRERLYDISWFMKLLNEYIARRANREDHCKGRFWDGRFKSQALLDNNALLSAMAYVDLNPVRAKMANTLIDSDYTSLQERMVTHAKTHSPTSPAASRTLPYEPERLPALLPFSDQISADLHATNTTEPIPFTFIAYVELVDWTGRQLRDDKRGALSADTKSALTDIGIEPVDWLNAVKRLKRDYGHAVGNVTSLNAWCEARGQAWVKGMGDSKRRIIQ